MGSLEGCSRKRLSRGGWLVAIVAAVAYLPSLGYGFIYDDYWTVVGNSHLDKGLSTLLRAAGSGRSVQWGMPDATRPAMGVSLWFDRELFGLSSGGYHLHSLALYALLSVLVYLLAFALFRSFAAALGAGLAFAVAPLHAEVAAVVNYREDLLASLGIVAAATLLFWPARREESTRPYLVLGLWFYALLSKESALVAPLLVTALSLVRRPARSLWPGILPVGTLVVAALWLNWRFGLSVLGEQIPQAEYASWADRVLRTVRFELLSLWRSLLPVATRPEYAALPAAHWLWLPAGVALFGVLAGLATRRGAHRCLGLLLVALVAPLISSPVFAPVNEFADRYWFLGSVAAALFVGWGAHTLRRRHALLSLGLLGAMSVAGIVACWSATSVWESETNLWTSAVSTAPRSPRAWASLSRVLRIAGHNDLAERTAERALEIQSDYVPGQVALALNRLAIGDRPGAGRVIAAIVPKSSLHRDALKLVERCAAPPADADVQECVQKNVPEGLVLGDSEQLRVRAQRLLER
jgi:hypothetical protein